MTFISIIILNYNGKEYLNECLYSVLNQDYLCFEVIFVDNGSTDGSVEFVKMTFGADKRLRIFKLKMNYGYAHGNNIGASTSNPKAKYIVFLNNDTKVEKNWLKALVNFMEGNPSVGVAQSKSIFYDNSDTIECAGGALNKFGFVKEVGHLEKDNGQYDTLGEIFYAKGVSMIIQKDVWVEAEGFDPFYFLYYEETDFCWRVRLMGYKIALAPKSVVYHARGSSIKKYFPVEIIFYDTRNRLITLLANYSTLNIIKYLPITIFLSILLSLTDIFKYRSPLAMYYRLSGLFSCLKNLKYIIRKRSTTQKLRKISDKKIEKYMLTKIF